MKFPEHIDIPLDAWIDAAMDWVLTTFSGFFEAAGLRPSSTS
jgi:ABC-type proline/glycine betaine transport system permease subunit